MKHPELVAHRGYTRHYPENTLASVEAAIAAGARFVEVDVQLTRDEVPVLFHDRTLQRLCDVEGAVHDYTAAQIAQYRASDFTRFGYKFAQERIPSLAAFVSVLRANPAVTAFIELKRISLARFGISLTLQRVLAELKPVFRQCVLISYSLTALRAARAHSPLPLGFVIDRWRDRARGGVRELHPEYLFCDADGLPRFGKLHHPGSKTVVFEIADAPRALRLAARGVDMIETFAIGELRREMEAIAPRA
jgi:glycerophosphoryl diester phosphodiesterase